MNALVKYQNTLPDEPQELAKFVLVGREKLTAVRAEIRAIDRVQLAQEVRDQKMEEARMLSEALLDAEVKLGDMAKMIPKAVKGNQYTGKMVDDTAVVNHSSVKATDSSADPQKQKTKYEVIQERGFTPKQVERFEKLADNKDLVELAKAQARENDDIPTRSQVLSMAQARQKRFDRDMSKIDEDKKIANTFHDALCAVLTLPDDPESVRSFIRGAWDVGSYTNKIDEAISKLVALRAKVNLERSKNRNGKN